MKAKHTTILLVSLAALFLTACQSTERTSADKKAAAPGIPSQGLSELKLTKLDGSSTDLKALLAQSELTVFHVWDPACEDCPDEMKVLDEVGTSYLGKGIQVVGIVKGVYNKSDDKTLDALKKAGVNYVQLLDSQELQETFPDTSSDTSYTILLGRDGRQLGETYTGAKDKAFWEKELEKYHSQVCVDDHPADCAVG